MLNFLQRKTKYKEVLIIAEERRRVLEQVGIRTSLVDYKENESLDLGKTVHDITLLKKSVPRMIRRLAKMTKERDKPKYEKIGNKEIPENKNKDKTDLSKFFDSDFRKFKDWLESQRDPWEYEKFLRSAYRLDDLIDSETQLYSFNAMKEMLSAYFQNIPLIRNYELFLIEKYKPNLVYRNFGTAFLKHDDVEERCKQLGIKFTSETEFDQCLENVDSYNAKRFIKNYNRVAVVTYVDSAIDAKQWLKDSGINVQVVMICPDVMYNL